MGQLAQHLYQDRPRWTGELRLTYDDGQEWLDDMALCRRQLGWRFLACDSPILHCWGFTSFPEPHQEPETWVHFLFPLTCRDTLPPVAEEALKSAEGRLRIIQVLHNMSKQPCQEPGSRWDLLMNDEIIEVTEDEDVTTQC